MSIQTPNNLDILLHYYCSIGPHPRLQAPAVQEGITYLYATGMIDRIDVPKVTDKGEAYIKHIMAVPFPEKHWIVPDIAHNIEARQ